MKMLKQRPGQAGFTLLELLVVLAILGLLAAIVGPQVIKYLGSSKTQTASVQVKNIAASLELFRLDAGRYPTAEEGLAGVKACVVVAFTRLVPEPRVDGMQYLGLVKVED